jgi:hypothetical protein
VNILSLWFARKINDSLTSANVEFTAGTEDGKVLSALQRMSYINEALFTLCGTWWKMLQGDKRAYAKVFPELVRTASVSMDANSKYTLANPNLDYDNLLEGTITDGSTIYYAEIASKEHYQALTYGALQTRATATQPKMIEMNGIIYALPAATFLSKAATLTILTQPLNPTDGSYLTQGGTYDSPFRDKWNDEIIKICVDLFKIDQQTT